MELGGGRELGRGEQAGVGRVGRGLVHGGRAAGSSRSSRPIGPAVVPQLYPFLPNISAENLISRPSPSPPLPPLVSPPQQRACPSFASPVLPRPSSSPSPTASSLRARAGAWASDGRGSRPQWAALALIQGHPGTLTRSCPRSRVLDRYRCPIVELNRSPAIRTGSPGGALTTVAHNSFWTARTDMRIDQRISVAHSHGQWLNRPPHTNSDPSAHYKYLLLSSRERGGASRRTGAFSETAHARATGSVQVAYVPVRRAGWE